MTTARFMDQPASIERIWLTMKARWFNNYVCKNEVDIRG